MSSSEVTLLAAAVSLVTSLVIQVVIAFLSQQEAKRKQRYEYLLHTIHALAEARGQIQWAQISLFRPRRDHEPLGADNVVDDIVSAITKSQRVEIFEKLQTAVGNAHAIMVAIDDPLIRRKGFEIMDTADASKQNELIKDALEYLGTRLTVEMSDQSANNR